MLASAITDALENDWHDFGFAAKNREFAAVSIGRSFSQSLPAEGKGLSVAKVLGLSLMFVFMMSTAVAHSEEFWAAVYARGKGDDFLQIIEPARPEAPRRRLRCTTSLPPYIEEMAESAKRVNGTLILRVRANVLSEQRGEHADSLKILMVCLLPDQSRPLLDQINGWAQLGAALPEDRTTDPFPQAVPRGEQ